MQSFVNCLNKRKGNKNNFKILLEIYDKLLDFERMSFIKDSIIKYIFDNPEMLTTYDKNDRDDFEISLNLQEIIFHILATNQLGKIYKLSFY